MTSFHDYLPLANLRTHVARLREAGRPLLCTEWLARGLGSLVATHLPYFRAERIGCFHWGLVNGRTQTHLPWLWSDPEREPVPWFHDVLHPDGAPYDPEEAALLRRLSGYRVRDGG